MEIKFYFICLLIFMSDCFLNGCKANELKICVVYEQTESTRQTKINLDEITINGEMAQRNFKQNINNGECFGLLIEDNVEVEELNFIFDIYVKPLENEYQPNGNDQMPMDDQPFEDSHFEMQMDDIRSMVRSVNVALYKPKFSKRYTFNLGKIDPPGLFWSRRVLIETESGMGNNYYHAMLYAVVTPNRRISTLQAEHIFLGYAPLVKIEGKADKVASNSQNQFTEYQLSIPINVRHLFKHQIWHLILDIFHYEQDSNLVDENVLMNVIENDANQTVECPICFNNLNNIESTMKLHNDYNQNSQHLFHKECIIKSIETQQKIRCPLCNREPKFFKTLNFYAIFNGSSSIPTAVLSMNPMAILYEIANNGQNEDEWKRIYANYVISKIIEAMDSKEAELKEMLLDAPFLAINSISDQKLFEIGIGGIQENPIVQQIENQLHTFLNQDENQLGDFINAKIMAMFISVIRNEANDMLVKAGNELENIQRISVDNI